jgi:putative ATPase
LGDEGLTIAQEAKEHLMNGSDGDARHALTGLDVSAVIAVENKRSTITLADTEAAMAMRALKYGDDEHYDVLSAFIKSIRGSDVDAGLYWLAQMLEAGEDPRLIARRLVILASEDIGVADSQCLLIADAAARAVEFVGMPEVQLVLAHAVVALARAPKSNSVTLALSAAQADVKSAGGRVPNHLRDSHYPGASELGHGEGYQSPHANPAGWVDQNYGPEGGEYGNYFVPSGRGDDQAGPDSP